MPDQVGAQLAVGEVPDLDHLVPAARDDERVARRGREAHAADPLGVAVLLDRVLALAERVPQLDRLVARARDDLAVVSRERDREHILLVRDEAAGGEARVDVPEAERAVPAARERELAVRRDGDVLHKVRMAAQRALGRAAQALVLVLAVEVPDDDGLVARAGEQHARLLHRARDARHPVAVALEHAAEGEGLGHAGWAFLCSGIVAQRLFKRSAPIMAAR